MKDGKMKEGRCPVCKRYGNIRARPSDGVRCCLFRCWSDHDFELSNAAYEAAHG